MNRLIRIFVISLLMLQVGCDQISKEVVRNQIDNDERIEVIKDFFTLTKVENPGAFLSLGDSLPETARILVFILFPSVLLVVAVVYMFRTKHLSLTARSAIALLIGGGIGNLTDRILYGSVTDFMHIDFMIFQTGVFNMADVSIMTGMFLLLGDKFLRPQKPVTT